MKKNNKITIFFLLFMFCISLAQAQNTNKSEQEKSRIQTAQLKLSDLLKLLESENTDELSTLLTVRGWRFDDNSVDREDYPAVYEKSEWSLDKNNSTGMAEGFFTFYRLNPQPNKFVMNDNKTEGVFIGKNGASVNVSLSYINYITYQMASDEHFRILENEFKANGYKKVLPAETINNELTISYQKSPYNITLVKNKNRAKQGPEFIYWLKIYNYKHVEGLLIEKTLETEEDSGDEAQLNLEDLLSIWGKNIEYAKDYLKRKNWNRNNFDHNKDTHFYDKDIVWPGYNCDVWNFPVKKTSDKQDYAALLFWYNSQQYSTEKDPYGNCLLEFKNDGIENILKYYPYNKQNPHFKQYNNISELSRRVIVHLINRIFIYENSEIDIVFRHSNKYILAKQFADCVASVESGVA